ncbi:MAG TPA: endonuclease III [Pseudothermotoga sp.]|nr:endonuclease III [Pseudothermotoga sp.]HPP69349.1 endonuclease III [Pseudothermotoga sp.]
MIKIAKRIVELFPRDKFTEDPFRILICTILSQRTRDENTEVACEKLFSQYSGPYALSKARPEKLYELIKASGMYKQKAERIVTVSRIIVEKYRGKVPSDLEELLKLPGVGRKTANIVLYHGFGKPALAVDTHVHRISNRIGFVNTKNPEQTEMELTKLIPSELWGPLNGAMVEFGRKICLPRNPLCNKCCFRTECDYFHETYKG